MIVDDSSFMRMIIKKALERLKLEIIEAENGSQAVELFKKEKPNLVVMDIVMPEKTGIQALGEMLKENSEAKIIMCSSMVNERAESEAKQIGALDFIKKPFKNDEFAKKIKQYI